MEKKLTFKMKVLRFTKKYKKRTTIHTLIATLILIFSLALIPVFDLALAQGEIRNTANEENLAIIFTGDLSFNQYYNHLIEKNQAAMISQFVKPYLEKADYVTGSVNGTYADPETMVLKDFNFSVLAIEEEKESNGELLKSNGLLPVGASLQGEEKIVYQKVQNITIATLGTSENLYVNDLKWIKEAKKNADQVVVHINWNSNYSEKVSETERSIAKALCDAGADFVIGHNAQVLKPIEFYNDAVIMYSLGNFLHGEVYGQTQNSAMVGLTLSESGLVESLSIIPLTVAAGRPEPVVSFWEGLNKKAIFDLLTKELPEDIGLSERDGILKLNLVRQ